MRILIHQQIENDINLCQKKRWYSGIELELPRLYRLLIIDKRLPGQTSLHHHGEKWVDKILHAKIALPKENCGGQGGGRLVYVVMEDKCLILYVGGHKDKRYDNSQSIKELVLERVEDTVFLEWVQQENF